MTSRQQAIWKAVRDFGPIVALALGVKVLWPADQMKDLNHRATGLETRADAVEASVNDLVDLVDGLALSQCLQEENAIARQRLQCGRREELAGIRRRR